jgi:hypothetical protein
MAYDMITDCPSCGVSHYDPEPCSKCQGQKVPTIARKRLTWQDAMTHTAIRYKQTLKFLSEN